MSQRLVAVSDSHGAVSALRNAATLAMDRGPIDAFVFLGDGMGDAQAVRPMLLARNPRMEYIAVRGNNDPIQSAPQEAFFSVNGLGIMATHGHLYRVKWGLTKLHYAARERGAAIALYGHTHRSHLEEAHGVLLVNPGAVCEGFTGRPVLADIVVQDDGSFQVKLVSEDGTEW
ncbi:MAG: YfcE family phosphodiesterase [Candidatus Limiplasma sp.]|nr:YfcE family phosphodiesterase [Candidatus Limiplasma sp.]